MRHIIDVEILEFDENGNTLWVHNSEGMTVLRIKCTGKIQVDNTCTNLSAHSDMIVEGDINICLPAE